MTLNGVTLMGFQNFLRGNRIFNCNTINEMLKLCVPDDIKPSSSNNKVKYYNIPCAFDIETSSFRTCENGEEVKKACMYVWTVGVNGCVCMGRTWDELLITFDSISKHFGADYNNRVVIYVHNLEFDFQFVRKHLNIVKLFAISNRKPLYAVTDNGIELRCSYLLSGYSLEYIGNNLSKYEVKKLVGDLDYRQIRHSQTPLTHEEKAYCVNDVRVVMAYIQEKIDSEGHISRLPLTKTGYVRRYCRDACFYGDGEKRRGDKWARYHKIMAELTLEPSEYKQLKRAFQGGFTHANPFFADKIVFDLTGFDYISSYPATLVSEKFPMSKSEKVNISSDKDPRFTESVKKYCCLFDVEFYGLRSTFWSDSYISSSRCDRKTLTKPTINNGRIVKADRLVTTITEQDYLIIKKCYRWDKMKIYNFRRYKKSYLPRDFVKAVLDLYKTKTELKGLEGFEEAYLQAKEMLNSCYGMAVTDIVRDIYEYDTEWKDKKQPNLYVEIVKYNKSKTRFLFYPWGVWVTAYARRNLFSGILEFNTDYVYSDTDSIKVRNVKNHLEYIKRYNSLITKQMKNAMRYHGFDESLTHPKNRKGEEKYLGIWDFDGHYKRFKTLGAKRYLVEYSNDERNGSDKGKIKLTVSGLNKKRVVPYLIKKYGDEVFEHFTNNLKIPAEYTGKLTHTYIDEEIEGDIVDYLGNRGHYKELSFIHLEPAKYDLSMAKEYLDYILNIETECI